MKKFILPFIALILTSCSSVKPTPTLTARKLTTAVPYAPAEINRIPAGSEYDTFVIKNNGKYIQFRCQNTPSPVYRDRIWRSESLDGVTNWTNDQIVIQGVNETDQDDLSCSPGVVIAPNGMWHMYYVTAARASVCGIQMWSAISSDGITWTKQGKIPSVPVSDCSLVEPSPIIEGNKIAVYFPVNWNNSNGRPTLWRMESVATDGFNFTTPTRINTPSKFYGGRVTLVSNVYVLAYSATLDGTNKIPDSAYITTSNVSPPSFTDGPLIAQVTPGTFFATQLIAGNYFDGKVYISGNYMPLCNGVPSATCSDYPNAIGVLLNVPCK